MLEMNTALLGFNEESFLYYRGITDTDTQEYVRAYAKMLEFRARGVETQFPRHPRGLSEHNRKLIHSNLERMCQKYFPRK